MNTLDLLLHPFRSWRHIRLVRAMTSPDLTSDPAFLLELYSTNQSMLRIAVGAYLNVDPEHIRPDSSLMPGMTRALSAFAVALREHRKGI